MLYMVTMMSIVLLLEITTLLRLLLMLMQVAGPVIHFGIGVKRITMST